MEETIKKDSSLDDLDLLFTFQGKNFDKVITLNTENICRIFRKHPHFQGRLRYNSFMAKKEVKLFSNIDLFVERSDHDDIIFQTEVSKMFSTFQKVSKQMISDAMDKVAFENTYDEAQDFMKALVWDKKERLGTWLTSAYGVPDDVYHRAVGTNWMVGLASRIMYPGSKFDHVLVVEGPQGAKKSESFSVLAGQKWHMETTMSLDKKDFYESLLGKIIVEFSEGETMNRASVEKMKGIITTKVDRFRVSYGRTAQDFPRRCVFAMTTNKDQYLMDETGSRRWLPVKIQKDQADTKWIADNREQLFAEAYHLLMNNHKFWEFPREETLAQQELRQERNPNESVVEEYLVKNATRVKLNGISVNEIYEQVFYKGFASKPIQRYDEMVIAGIFKNLGLERQRRMINNVRQWLWFWDKNRKVDTLIESDFEKIYSEAEIIEEDDF